MYNTRQMPSDYRQNQPMELDAHLMQKAARQGQVQGAEQYVPMYG